MGWWYLILVILGATLVWPLGRWAMRKDGNAQVLGFWISLISTLIGFTFVILTGQHFWTWQVLAAGTLFGIAYSVGFCVLIMYCLKIGPVGPTVTINNLAMICGVLYGMVWLKPHIPNSLTFVGIAGTVLALVFIGHKSSSPDSVRRINRSWLKLVLVGGAFSGFSFMAQTYVGIRYPDQSFIFVASGFAVSTLILLPLVLALPDFFHRRSERWVGIFMGIINGFLLPLTFAALKQFSVEVVFPITVTTPMILMLLMGHFLYREYLTKTTLAGCCLGILSVGILACSR
ncbi:MAG: EamA family transporter [Phycisphaerae bacterium]